MFTVVGVGVVVCTVVGIGVVVCTVVGLVVVGIEIAVVVVETVFGVTLQQTMPYAPKTLKINKVKNKNITKNTLIDDNLNE